jgi:hypothetical protein
MACTDFYRDLYTPEVRSEAAIQAEQEILDAVPISILQ